MRMRAKRGWGRGWGLTVSDAIVVAMVLALAGWFVIEMSTPNAPASAREAAGEGRAAEGLPVRRVGDWNGYEVLWVNDSTSASRSRGFYAFKASDSARGRSDFPAPALVGTIGGEALYYVRDTHGASRAPGFYALERGGVLTPMTASGAASGKSSISYGAAMVGADGRLDMGAAGELARLSAEELDELAKAAQAAAWAKRGAGPSAER